MSGEDNRFAGSSNPQTPSIREAPTIKLRASSIENRAFKKENAQPRKHTGPSCKQAGGSTLNVQRTMIERPVGRIVVTLLTVQRRGAVPFYLSRRSLARRRINYQLVEFFPCLSQAVIPKENSRLQHNPGTGEFRSCYMMRWIFRIIVLSVVGKLVNRYLGSRQPEPRSQG